MDLVDDDPLRQFGDEARRIAAEFVLDDVSVMTRVAAKKTAGVIPRIFTELAAGTGLTRRLYPEAAKNGCGSVMDRPMTASACFGKQMIGPPVEALCWRIVLESCRHRSVAWL